MSDRPFLSICIPSYNSDRRPGNIFRLLSTVDCKAANDIEIVICDDRSPNIGDVRRAVNEFSVKSTYKVLFFENERNLGYDGNLKELIKRATGEWIVFMGDDDEFINGALDKLIDFLKNHDDLGYVLKSHVTMRKKGIEKFRYYDGNKFFPPGSETLVALFRKSVFISGFTIRRKFLPTPIDNFDHSLLYQHYLLGEVVLKHPAAYFDEPLTRQYDSGVEISGKEGAKSPHVARTPSIETSIGFLKSFLIIPEFFDEKYGLRTADAIRRDMSKYFYPTLAVHRNKGIRIFLRYANDLRNLGFGCTIYFYLYTVLLAVFGTRICDEGIRLIKGALKRTPQL